MKGRSMLRATIAALVANALLATAARAQLREVRQVIYGMD